MTTSPGSDTTTIQPKEEETTTGSSSETTTGSSETTTMQQETTSKRPQKPANSSCPPLEEGQAHFVCPTGFKRHPKDCQMFYQCTQSPETSHLSIVTFNCPNGTVYDEQEIQCRDQTEEDECASGTGSSLLRDIDIRFDAEETSPIVRFAIISIYMSFYY